jgi:hypothetical protein
MLTSYKAFLFHVMGRHGSVEINQLERLDLLQVLLGGRCLGNVIVIQSHPSKGLVSM